MDFETWKMAFNATKALICENHERIKYLQKHKIYRYFSIREQEKLLKKDEELIERLKFYVEQIKKLEK